LGQGRGGGGVKDGRVASLQGATTAFLSPWSKSSHHHPKLDSAPKEGLCDDEGRIEGRGAAPRGSCARCPAPRGPPGAGASTPQRRLKPSPRGPSARALGARSPPGCGPASPGARPRACLPRRAALSRAAPRRPDGAGGAGGACMRGACAGRWSGGRPSRKRSIHGRSSPDGERLAAIPNLRRGAAREAGRGRRGPTREGRHAPVAGVAGLIASERRHDLLQQLDDDAVRGDRADGARAALAVRREHGAAAARRHRVAGPGASEPPWAALRAEERP
jgi:hypothetical protein